MGRTAADKQDDLRAQNLAARDQARAALAKKKLEEEAKEASAAGLPPPVVDLSDDAPEGEEPFGVTSSAVGDAPDWARVPADLKMPAGWTVWFVRIRAAWTNCPAKGDRQAILWNLSAADEKIAARRSEGDSLRLSGEMALQMVRAFDGQAVVDADSIRRRNLWWDEIGGKARSQLKGIWARTHMMDEKENADFFGSCITSRTAG